MATTHADSYEIEVTDLSREELCLYSASQAEMGPDAGRITWRNSEGYARDNCPITDANRDNVRAFFGDFGAWERDEIDGWDDTELGALLIQMAAGDLREAESVAWDDDACAVDAEVYEREANKGRISGRLYFSGGRVWFSFAR
jgi:hypothetical protein